MLASGIYLPPSQYEAWFISLAHSQELIEQTIEAAAKAFAAVAASGPSSRRAVPGVDGVEEPVIPSCSASRPTSRAS